MRGNGPELKLSKKFKKYSHFADHVDTLGAPLGLPASAAKFAAWSGYAVALGAIESIFGEGLSTEKVAKRRKKAVRHLHRLAKAAGGVEAVRPPLVVEETAAVVEPETRADAANVVQLKPVKKKKQKAAVETDLIDEGRPQGFDEPRNDSADDLKLIAGVGPKLEGTLNRLGIWHFDQIAAWSEHEVAWVDNYLQFKGRIERDEWIAQAAALAAGGHDEYVKRFGKEPR